MMTTTTATRSNAYAGTCSGCGNRVAAHEGLLGDKVNGRWTVKHTDCTTPTTHSARTRTRGHACEACGARNAHWAYDMSGIGGYACHRCDDGTLSLY